MHNLREYLALTIVLFNKEDISNKSMKKERNQTKKTKITITNS